MNVKLSSLIEKLNRTCLAALEAASTACARRRSYEIEVEHVLVQFLDDATSDISRVCDHYGVDTSKALKALCCEVERMRTGSQRPPIFSTELETLLVDSWTLGSINYRADQIRSGLLLLTLISNPGLARRLGDICDEFRKIPADDFRKNLPSLLSKTKEEDVPAIPQEHVEPGERATERVSRSSALAPVSNLDKYTVDMTRAAEQGTIDPVVGREREIRQIIDILMRRRQNNPILTGEAGVGKTAIVEGFALKVASGEVPPALRDVRVRLLDLGLLQAGAGIKGEFENRLKGVIAEVKSSATPIILFIDEAHTIIGAGGTAGQSDAANLLKPALARGELRTIAATTWSEYKKYFEKDAALARRFQVVKVEEPDENTAMTMVRGLVKTLEGHHKVTVLNDAVEAAVRLSARYLSGRQMPDKCVSVLDTACARVAVSQAAPPEEVDGCDQELRHLDTEMSSLQREAEQGNDHSQRLKQLAGEKEILEKRKLDLAAQYTVEKDLVTRILSSIAPIPEGGAHSLPGGGMAAPAAVHQTLQKLKAELIAAQGERPLVKPFVDAQSVAEVISNWTGVPLGRMVKDEFQTLLTLEDLLQRRVVGQPHALHEISEQVRTARAGMDNPARPMGVFLLVGPSGVGKTETALALADVLYSGERSLVTINMSEFKEPHSISGLKGSPPGYVGYGEGGVLTEAIRKKPYSVLLLDEFEKAHADVQELFYQVFDKGFLEDAEGRRIDFRNTLIIMTSNAAAEVILHSCSGSKERPAPDAMAAAVKERLLEFFKDAFLGRCMVVPFYPLDSVSLRRIVEMKLEQIGIRLEQNHRIVFTFAGKLTAEIAKRCTEVRTGARNVEHILTGTVLSAVSREIVTSMAQGLQPKRVHVSYDRKGVTCRLT